MPTITFNCRFITPAFLGGADPKGTPELRPPSIKGALRFWWRAQSGISDVKKLRERESLIFGGVEGEKAIKSSFSIHVKHEDFELDDRLPRSEVMVKSMLRNLIWPIF